MKKTYSKLLCASSALAMTSLMSSVAFAQSAAAPAAGAPAEAVQEVVVTGTRLKTGFTTPTPVTTMTVVQMQDVAPNSVGDALAQLPSFLGSRTTSNVGAVSAGTGDAQALLNLRNLGANRVLVLLNGERLPASNANGSVDTNLIPQALIERVDVVTGGASAAYGSDAVAGVANFILNTHFKGLALNVNGGETTYGDAANEHFSLTYGTSFLDDKLRVEGSAELFHQDGIGLGANGRGWYDHSYGSEPNPVAGGTPSTLIIPDARFSSGTYGGLITTKGAAGLSGMQFGAGGVLLPFNTGANTGTSFQSGGDGPSAVNGLSPTQDRGTGFFHAEYDLTDKMTVFGEASYSQSHTVQIGAYPFEFSTKGFTIYNDNAYLPAAVSSLMAADKINSFVIGRLSSDLQPITNNDTTTMWRIAGGVRGALGNGWAYDSSLGYSALNQNFKQTDTINRNLYAAADAVVVTAANVGTSGFALGSIQCRSSLAGLDPGCVPINVLGTNTISAAGRNYVEGWDDGNFTDHQLAFNANLRGDLGEKFNLGAGEISFAVGGAYRRDTAYRTVSPLSAVYTSCAGLRAGGCTPYNNAYGGYQSYNPGPLSGSISATEGYLEVGVPLLKDLPLIKALDVDVAGRMTDYSISGVTYTWKIGPTWRITDDLRVRATRSQDIRAPNLTELYSPGTSATNNQVFPGSSAVFIGGQNVPIQAITIGNPNLKPEVAQTSTVGFVYQPSWLHGFQGSLDYYDINIQGAIASVGASTIIDGCFQGNAAYCKFISVGGTPVTSTSGILPTTAGVVVQSPTLNINSLKTSGLDLELAYAHPLLGGNLTTRGLASYMLTDANSANTSANSKLIGSLSVAGGVPLWTSVLNEEYEHRLSEKTSYSLSLTERLISSGSINANLSPIQISQNAVPQITYTDMTATYKFKRFGADEQIYFNVINLFNVNPPAVPSASSFQSSTNYTLYDVLGRRFTLGFRLKY